MPRRLPTWLWAWIGMGLLVWDGRIAQAAEPRPRDAPPKLRTVEFNRDVRPILSDNCFACHGPDKNKRKADLRLDTEEGAFGDRGEVVIIVPGKPEQSELFRRISTTDEKLRMPKAKFGKKLSAQQIDLVRQWILQGAKWQKHWSLIPPERPELPAVQNASWVVNPIDRFVLDRLDREGLKPSREADRRTLMRRFFFALFLPAPAPPKGDVFFTATSPESHEKLVGNLLTSAHYLERLA